MDISQISEPLKQFVKKISNSIKVDEVIIFGSHLEGDATEDSDIDILVISDDFKALSEDQRFDLLHPARLDIEPEIDPWGFTKEELEKASHLTLMGYVRDNGIHYDPSKI